ncbi:hypothetical protein [Streptomyces sp. NPDC005181]|uniref:hypothetical protein n=1 Tax=Streptomyces sp. NPDC005181 TaxID=3156869 RepID=UPI00339E3919
MGGEPRPGGFRITAQGAGVLQQRRAAWVPCRAATTAIGFRVLAVLCVALHVHGRRYGPQRR